MDDNPETLPLYVKISQNHHRLRLSESQPSLPISCKPLQSRIM
jgi:hypothetical protein